MLGYEEFNDDHRFAAVAAGEGGRVVLRVFVSRVGALDLCPGLALQQCPGDFQVVLARGIGKESVMADAMKA